MIQIDMEITDFLSAWPHCDYLSNYISRMVSHNRSDSVLHSRLFHRHWTNSWSLPFAHAAAVVDGDTLRSLLGR